MQIAKLQEDNKALDRLTKSKEAALLEAEKTVKTALAKASLVDDLQNRNQDLTKQIDICQVYIGNTAIVLSYPAAFCSRNVFRSTPFFQEENRILDRLHRQKIAEVEKLSQTVKELEEAVLAGGAAANAVRDYQRKVQEMSVMFLSLSGNLHTNISLLAEKYVVYIRMKRKLWTESWPVQK